MIENKNLLEHVIIHKMLASGWITVGSDCVSKWEGQQYRCYRTEDVTPKILRMLQLLTTVMATDIRKDSNRQNALEAVTEVAVRVSIHCTRHQTDECPS